MFEPKTAALQGKRILVTRTREQASAFSERLEALGAIPVEFPTIRIVPPTDWGALDAALQRLIAPRSEQERYSWLVFTSANGVTITLDRLQSLGYAVQALKNMRIATIGPATAQALTSYGLQAELIPDEYIAEGVVEGLLEDARKHGTSIAGQRILLARAAEARRVLVTELKRAGADVDEVAAYTTETVARDDERGRDILHLLQDGQLDILTFTSSSTVKNFVRWLKSCEQDGNDFMKLVTSTSSLKIACIGPITAQTARELGLRVDIEAKEFTIAGLSAALVEYEEQKA